MKSLIITVFIIITSCSTGFSQSKYSLKVETGYMSFGFRTITVDDGPNWKGYNLDNEQDGIGINLISGFTFKEKMYAGLGIGYLNFDLNYEGINGISMFSDFEFIPSTKKLSPLLNTKIGYSQIWNRYEKGRGSALVELGVGFIYKLTESRGVFLQSGVLLNQQSAFLPIRIGLHF